MAIFEFGFSSLLFFPFLCPVFNLAQDLLMMALDIKGHLFLKTAIYFLGEMLGFFIVIYLHKKETLHNEKSILLNKHIQHNNAKKTLEEKQKYLKFLILLSCIFEFLINLLMNAFLTNLFLYKTIQLEAKAVPLFAIALFNKWFLKVPFEKHNIFAMIIISIGAGSVFIKHFCPPEEKDFGLACIITLLFMIIKIITGAIELLDTYLLQEKYASPFILLSLQGLFGFVASIIGGLIFNKRNCSNIGNTNFCTEITTGVFQMENINEFFTKIGKPSSIVMIVFYLCFGLALNFFRMQTKYYLSAFHRVLSCISTAIVNWFVFLVKFRNDNKQSESPGTSEPPQPFGSGQFDYAI